MASIACALERVTGSDGDRRRAALWSNVTRLHRALGRDGAPPPSPIVPLLVGDNALAVSLAGALLERGWHVQPIRPPTVPDGTARLRLTVCALHTAEQIDALAADLHALFDAAALSVAPRTTEPSLRAAP
jgi:7-keto-8-aminopelargonate synthetase-like enzyme